MPQVVDSARNRVLGDAAVCDQIDGPDHAAGIEMMDHVPGARQHIKAAARDRAVKALGPPVWRSGPACSEATAAKRAA